MYKDYLQAYSLQHRSWHLYYKKRLGKSFSKSKVQTFVQTVLNRLNFKMKFCRKQSSHNLSTELSFESKTYNSMILHWKKIIASRQEDGTGVLSTPIVAVISP